MPYLNTQFYCLRIQLLSPLLMQGAVVSKSESISNIDGTAEEVPIEPTNNKGGAVSEEETIANAFMQTVTKVLLVAAASSPENGVSSESSFLQSL